MAQSELVVRIGDRSYRIERRWCAPPREHAFGFISDVVVDLRGNVHVGHRGGDAPVLVFDDSGRFLRSWGKGRIADVHYMSVTPDGHILVADRTRTKSSNSTPTETCAAAWGPVMSRTGRRRSTIRPQRSGLPTGTCSSPTDTAISRFTGFLPAAPCCRPGAGRVQARENSPRRTASGRCRRTAFWWQTGKTTASRCLTAKEGGSMTGGASFTR